jgi:hypothetical protein
VCFAKYLRLEIAIARAIVQSVAHSLDITDPSFFTVENLKKNIKARMEKIIQPESLAALDIPMGTFSRRTLEDTLKHIARALTLAIRLPEHIKKKLEGKKHEPPCLSLIDTEIHDLKLHLTCYFRSWDAYAGLPANIAGIQILTEAITSEINQRGNLNIQTGKLIFHSKNCHIYQRQFKIIESLMKPQNKTRHKSLQPKTKNQPKTTI